MNIAYNMKPRLALLNAAHGGDNTRRNFRRELDADLVEFNVTEGERPRGYDYDGLVVTGSRSSVYWDEPWIDPLIEYVADAAEHGLPILGVCYGHQVLAEALGGHVAAMDGFEIGYNTIERLTDDELFDGLDREFTAFTTHGDAVIELPPGSQVIAQNEYGIHAFRRGHCFGVQFHPEYDMQTARTVTEGKKERIAPDRVAQTLEEITPENYAAACEAKVIFDNFTEYVRSLTDADTMTHERAAIEDSTNAGV